jgi:hypothetical protein
VHQRGAKPEVRLGQPANGEGIHLKSQLQASLAIVHPMKGGRVDNDIRSVPLKSQPDRLRVRNFDLSVGQRGGGLLGQDLH